jgi:hypothetical protein
MKKVYEISYEEGEGELKEEFYGKITLKRLDFGETNALKEEIAEIRVMGSMPSVKISSTKATEVAILKSCVESDIIKRTYYVDKVTKEIKAKEEPYPINLITIQRLPDFLGQYIFDKYNELNTVEEKKKEQLEIK